MNIKYKTQTHKDQLGLGEYNKMSNIKETAEAYELPQRKNISDLDSVSVDMEITEEEFTKKDGDVFTIKSIEVDGEKYRVPNSVIASLKEILEVKPDTKNFKVTKKGSGLDTKYTVVAL